MKFLLRSILIPSVLALIIYTSLTAIDYKSLYAPSSFKSVNDTGTEFPGDSNETESTVYEPTIFNPNDLSSAFNESGYMSSNSVNMDGKEIINDFNGNLLYQIPMWKGMGEGDLAYDVSLTYNGNVNYQICTSAIQSFTHQGPDFRSYNISAPGWIYSVNGFAVQMLNFESNFFTNPSLTPVSGGSELIAQGNQVHLLATGYDLTDDMEFVPESNAQADKISIMLGDGSVQTFENDVKTKNPDAFTHYTGWYHSPEKNSNMKAYVEFMNYSSGVAINPSNSDDYPKTPRKMYVMKGDGLQYIFEEQVVNYNDFSSTASNIPPRYQQLVFVLKSIKDRFGHTNSLTYLETGSYKGRPKISTLPGFQFKYGGGYDSYYNIKAEGFEGNYVFHTPYWGTSDGTNHRPKLEDYSNPSGESTTFEYSPYNRTGYNLRGVVTPVTNYEEQEFTLKVGGSSGISQLTRLSSITEAKRDGYLKKQYTYFDENADLEMNFTYTTGAHGAPEVAHSPFDAEPSLYFGQGRDLFYANMIGTSTVIKSGVNLRREYFGYSYNSYGREDVASQPIDYADDYGSTRNMVSFSGSENLNDTPESSISTKSYKNYRTKLFIDGGNFNNYEGSIKLVKDEAADQSDNIFKTTSYTYWGDNPGHHVVSGTLLEKSITEDYNGVSRTSQFAYELVTGTGHMSGTENMVGKKETDPLGKTTQTNYTYLFKENFLVYKEGTFRDPNYFSDVFDSTRIYIKDMPTDVKIYKNPTDTDPLQRKKMIYQEFVPVTTGTNAIAYPGQLLKEQDLDPLPGTVLRETAFLYYNKDTSGYYMFNDVHFSNRNEGKLAQIINPNGKKNKYYYNLISRAEEEGYCPDCVVPDEAQNSPKLSYHKLYDNGTDKLEKSSWASNNISLPSRIDRYLNEDYFLTTYQQYNGMGNPTGIVNENNYFSEARYDKYYRLGSLTLPYDFNDTLADVQKVVTYHDQTIEITSKSIEWGGANLVTGEWYLEDHPVDENYFTGVGVDRHNSTGDPDAPQKAIIPLLKFDDVNFSNIYSIQSAYLDIAPYYARAFDNNVIKPNGYNLIVKPLKQVYEFAPNVRHWEFGTGSMSASTLPISQYQSCFSREDIIKKYDSNKVTLDVTTLLNNNILNGNLNIQGLSFDMSQHGAFFSTDAKFDMKLYFCIPYMGTGITFNEYYALYSPTLRISATVRTYDTTTVTTYRNGTLMYNYSDKDDSVQVFNKMYKASGQNVHKRSTHSFDELGRLTKTKQYASYNSDTNIFKTGYNYLDQKAKSTDARNNVTNFSYDKYGNLSETDNADASSSFLNSTYSSSIGTAFYTLSNSFVNKQEFIDETGRHYLKYFDAAGRILRETKFVSEEEVGIPDIYNPDSNYVSRDIPADVALNTDYRYDSLYRVNCVQTPAGKRIWYNYDMLGRQTKRITPDAGTTTYAYDINNNLLTSQDANQLGVGSDVFTYRTYDGLNRLITISESQTQIGFTDFADAVNSEYQLDFTTSNDDLLTINVYDTLVQHPSNPFNAIFSNIPANYFFSDHNNTKGALLATAFRTRRTDDWNYKFYRYDARGRVAKMWTYLDELGWHWESYSYNSQNQVIVNHYDATKTDSISFMNNYDVLGRLSKVTLLKTSQQVAGYTYNPNSQILTSSLMTDMPVTSYTYGNRNWVNIIRSSNSSGDIFKEVMTYNANGNINEQMLQGSYKDNFAITDDLYYHYIYDKSNRLLKADGTIASSEENLYDITNTYDHDGNTTHLTRYEDDKNPSDDFAYDYQTGTNKLLKVRGGGTNDYAYDQNGNLLIDNVNDVWDMKYDMRNLLLSCNAKNADIDDPNSEKIYYSKYYYDEAGNRVCKSIWEYGGSDPQPVYPAGSWTFKMNEFYVHDVSGGEVAVYSGYESIKFWNIWGTDNAGQINVDGSKQFYIKDHLGSVRCVIDAKNDMVSAQDFDAWGHKMTGRKYQSDQSKYQFTSKERDIETDYDYFGARYYDSRIGRWGGVDLFQNNHLSKSPYAYAMNNPIILIDRWGLDVDVSDLVKNMKPSEVDELVKNLSKITGLNLYITGGLLKIKEGSIAKGGSTTAREFVSGAIGSKEVLQIRYSETERSHTKVGSLTVWYHPEDGSDFVEYGLNENTLGSGMVLIHEMLHSGIDGGLAVDDIHGFGNTGLVVDEMNVIRGELGKDYGQRMSYDDLPITIGDRRYIPFDQKTFDMMNAVYQSAKKGDFNLNDFENKLIGKKYIMYHDK